MRANLSLIPLILLISTGTTQAQVSYNQEFAPDVPAPAGFRANRTSYSAIMDVLGKNQTEISAEKLEQLKSVPLEVIFGAVGDYRTMPQDLKTPNQVNAWSDEH